MYVAICCTETESHPPLVMFIVPKSPFLLTLESICLPLPAHSFKKKLLLKPVSSPTQTVFSTQQNQSLGVAL